jgi:hypothetical protein
MAPNKLLVPYTTNRDHYASKCTVMIAKATDKLCKNQDEENFKWF